MISDITSQSRIASWPNRDGPLGWVRGHRVHEARTIDFETVALVLALQIMGRSANNHFETTAPTPKSTRLDGAGYLIGFRLPKRNDPNMPRFIDKILLLLSCLALDL